MFRPLCSPFSPDSLQMVSYLHRMFRPWTMTSSTWWVNSDCQSTIRRTLTWHNLSGAPVITSMMPPTPVFLLLFLMLFLKVHHVSSFHTDWAGNSTDLYSQTHHPLFLKTVMRSYLKIFYCVPPHIFPIGESDLLRTASFRPTALRLTFTLRPVLG